MRRLWDMLLGRAKRRRAQCFQALGPLLALLVWSLCPGDTHVARMAGLATWMAVWWVTEALPLYVTSLLPLFMFPLLSISSLREVTVSYSNPTIYLFLGGFILALGLQRAGLHRRIALRIVTAIGSSPSRLILGFMLSTAALSMWISNTASVLVMLPIALSVLEETGGRKTPAGSSIGTALMLGIAYSADIGGMATPVGTPPNLILLELWSQLFPDAPPIGFGNWMLLGLPLAILFLFFGWLLLTRFLFRFSSDPLLGDQAKIQSARDSLGPVRRDEVLAGACFAGAALLWITGEGLRLGESVSIPGWRSVEGLEELKDGAVAIAAATLLFLLPSAERKSEGLLDWDTVQREVPWGLLLLFGGGFALAAGFKSSGLSMAIGGALGRLEGVPPLLLVASVCLVLTFLTELTSNTATTTLVLPILAQAAVSLGVDPRAFMIPATLSASCAFMMPVASPTQAIVFGSGYVSIRQMVRAGIWFNFMGVALVTVLFAILGPLVFGLDLSELPHWAGK